MKHILKILFLLITIIGNNTKAMRPGKPLHIEKQLLDACKAGDSEKVQTLLEAPTQIPL